MGKFKTVLIVTYGRTGSTLLMGLLNSIDGYSIKGENHNSFVGLFESVGSMRRTNGRRNMGRTTRDPWYGAGQYDIQQYVADLSKAAKTLLMAGSEHDASIRCIGFKEIRYPQLMLKTPARLFEYLDFLNVLFDDCAVIFNTRDHAAVVNSDWWKNEDPERLSQRFQKFEVAALSYGNGRPNFYHIRYEDLVGRTDRLRGMFEFLGEEYDPTKVEEVLGVRHSTKGRTE